MLKDSFKTISQIVFIAISFVFVVLIATGFDINAEKLADLKFWGEVSLKEVILIIMFNVIYDMDLRNRKKNTSSKFYRQLGTKQLRVRRIYNEDLFHLLQEGVRTENQERFAFEAERQLHKVTLRLRYSDLPSTEKAVDLDKWVNEVKEKYSINDKIVPQLKKCVVKILSGKIKVNEVTEDGILSDFDREYNRRQKPLLFDGSDLKRKQSLAKAGTFLLSSIALTIVTFSPTLADIWQSLLVNVMLMLSATVSALSASYFYLDAQTQILERQNAFLSKRMGLKDEFVMKKEGS